MKHVYFHFPFCLKKCHYCDFSSVACGRDQIPHEEYVGALAKEITLPPIGGGDILDTVFLGGGTPSLMRPGDIERILNALQKKHPFSSNIEITLEVNPGSVNPSKLAEFRAAGVNRFSIGVQSFDDENLRWFGRIHTVEEGRQMVRAAQALAGCRVGLDLIYGFPNQTVDDWKKNLEEAVALGVKHVSAYALTMPEVVGAASVRRKFVRSETPLLPNVDVAADMQEMTYEFMKNAGLPAYEISNFAVLGEESRHNLGYWRYEDFVGLGAGAVSQCRGVMHYAPTVIRKTNTKNPFGYMRAIEEGNKHFTEEMIDQKTAEFEFIMMGLRMREGVLEKRFEGRFGKKMFEVYANAIAKTSQVGLLEIHTDLVGDRSIAPTRPGMCLNNQLVGEFVPVISRTQV